MIARPVSFTGAPPRRILVRSVNWLGDAVMSTPALLRLRQAYPDAHLTLLTPSKLSDLWKAHPALDALLEFDRRESVFAVAARLRVGGYDTALILPNSPRSALEAWLARIPRRVGAARPWRDLLLTTRAPRRPEEIRMHKPSRGEVQRRIAGTAPVPVISPQAHHLYHYLHLAAVLGADPTPLAPLIAVVPERVAAVRERFQAPDSAPLFGLNPGAEYGPAKRWPAERFVAAAVALHRQLGCHWWVFGGPAEVGLASSIAGQIANAIGSREAGAASPIKCLAGQTSLGELCAALHTCDLILTNDSGPMHLAAAVGTSVVAPFGSTSPELTRPGLPEAGSNVMGPEELRLSQPAVSALQHEILRVPVDCAPCFLKVCPIDSRCMTGIPVEAVVAAVTRAFLAGAAENRL
ncbi:MAG TPA: lipopolysaccharide heptosyltransferase II [Verrucomicrobiae bacterium]|nr:lipopolysaccharide heptosyltransferase II [Verrucomicrobiae bacterium]